MRTRRTLTCLAKCLMWPSPTLSTPSRLRWFPSVSPPRTTRVWRQPRSLSGTGYHHLSLVRHSDMLLARLGPPLYDYPPYRTDVSSTSNYCSNTRIMSYTLIPTCGRGCVGLVVGLDTMVLPA
ncbi:hypothetical protein B0H14DRAFT_1516897 [Mycena olivaceomarginata]|nr:hypothetical protein B0H14DRAFT_1516897 [Mycena olivaceomarginata]